MWGGTWPALSCTGLDKRWRKLCQELMILGIKKYLGWSWSLEGQDVSSGGEESPKGARVAAKGSQAKIAHAPRYNSSGSWLQRGCPWARGGRMGPHKMPSWSWE